MGAQARIDRILHALAEPTRRAVVDLLRDGPLRAGALASGLGASRPALSRHLRVLREADVIEEVRPKGDGRGRLIHLRAETLGEVQDWVSEAQSFWSARARG